jgi:hypothetical protein
MKNIITADWGPALHRAARVIAVLVVATYVAGETVGLWVHGTNDTLAAGWSALVLGRPAAAAQPAAAALAIGSPLSDQEIRDRLIREASDATHVIAMKASDVVVRKVATGPSCRRAVFQLALEEEPKGFGRRDG